MKDLHPRQAALILVIAVVFLNSCASVKTQQGQYKTTVPMVQEGTYGEAAEIIEFEKDKTYKEKDRVLFFLDLGMLYHWDGQYELSNQMLTEAEYAIEELFTKSFSKAVLSGVLNDNALDYPGEDYEDIYLNIFKALNYIALDDLEAAHVEIRRVQIKLDLLEDKYKNLAEEYNESSSAEGELQYRENRFHNDVLARYLSLLLYRAEASYDDVRIDTEAIRAAWKSQSHLYSFELPDLPMQRPPENVALVNLISFSGLGPVKLADTLYLHSGSNVIFVSMTGQSDDYVNNLLGFTILPMPGLESGLHFKIQFPRLVDRGTEADRVVLVLNGEPAAEAELLESMESIARESFQLRQPVTIGKTIIRATVKNVSKEIGKDAMQDSLADQGAGGFFLGLMAGLAADVAVDATENADLRISHFFPSDARVVEMAVTPGIYDVSVEYWKGRNLLSRIDHGTKEFREGDLNLIESYVLR